MINSDISLSFPDRDQKLAFVDDLDYYQAVKVQAQVTQELRFSKEGSHEQAKQYSIGTKFLS